MYILNRRNFLKALTAFPILQLLKPEFSFAQGAGIGKNLIFINLAGGFDSFAAFPYLLDPNVSNQAQGFVQFLQDNRPDTFMLPQNNLLNPSVQYLANSYLGFSPAWASIYPEFNNGTIKLIQGVGIDTSGMTYGSHNFCENCYTYADKSYVGGVSKAWFARTIETLGLTHNQAFSFGTLGRADFATQPPVTPPIVAMSAEAVSWQDQLGASRQDLNIQTSRQLLALSNPSNTAQEKIKEALGRSLDAVELMNQVKIATNPTGNRALIGSYPTVYSPNIGYTLKSIARITSYFHGDNQNRLFYAYQGGFDSHSLQGGFNLSTGAPEGYVYQYLQTVASSLKALIDDLKNPARYAWDKTIIVIFSEFGRGARQNGSQGTDHGNGSIFMVLGGPVQGGVVGTPPTYDMLNQRNWYLPQVAFQNVFAPVVNWFGANEEELFPRARYVRNEAVASSIIA